MAQDHIKAISDHIESTIRILNPHTDSRLHTVYIRGFLQGHLASIFHNDPILYREFLEHCEKIALKQHKKIDKHRK